MHIFFCECTSFKNIIVGDVLLKQLDDQSPKIYSYAISSTYGIKVLKAFDDKPRFPSELAKSQNKIKPCK